MRPDDVGLLAWRRQRNVSVSIHRPGPTPWHWRPSSEPSPPFLSVVLLLEGTVTVRIADAHIEDATGVMLHGIRETWTEFSRNAICAIVWMPTEILAHQGIPLPSAPLILPSSAVATAMQRFTASIVHRPAESPIGAYIVERLFVEMTLGLMLHSKEDTKAPRSTRRLHERAHALILANSADPGFGTEEIAHSLGVSTRQLQRAFAEVGTSPMAALRDARVAHAKTFVCDSTYDALSVAEIARECGFGSAATMRRAFQATGVEWPSRRRRPPASPSAGEEMSRSESA
ncbi:MAG: helix-turn-helix domain-containing protein [Microbacterium sp.]